MNEEIRIELASMSSDIDKLKNLLHSYEKFIEEVKKHIPHFIFFPESSSQCNFTESILKKRFCQEFIYIRKYLDFSMGFQVV